MYFIGYKNLYFSSLFCLLLIILFSCSSKTRTYTVIVNNDSEIIRNNESIEVWFDQLNQLKNAQTIWRVFDDSGQEIRSQLVDIDLDSVQDYLLFQTNFNPFETKKFTVIQSDSVIIQKESKLTTFCRFVPERMDDFAWENDKVAFRTYGPECQRLFEAGNPAGLISSGIDCWLKRVDYPIIDKWYGNHQKGVSYHVDHGEGLDNFHVGTTRGCGGTALIYNNHSFLSKNFVSYKIIANGPIRSIFELEYAPIEFYDNTASETKRITIDLGSNLYQCEVFYTSEAILNKASTGITLHNGAGDIKSNIEEGWISYWEPLDDSFLGTAILLNTNTISGYNLDSTIYEDESLNNISINTKLTKNSFSYWSGFGWKKNGRFQNHEDWTNYLKLESFKKNNPLKKVITNK